MDSKAPAERQNVKLPPSFERFCQLVLEDDALHKALRETPDTESFIALTVELAQSHGCDFTPDDLRQALEDKRREWLERWV
jgi:hypothetical protein